MTAAAEPLIARRASQARDGSSSRDIAPAERHRDRRAALLLFLVVWVVYLATATYTVNQVNDNRATTVTAWSLGTRGTIDLPASWRGEIPWEAEGSDGSLHTDRFPGAWLWAAPFHAVAGALDGDAIPHHPALIDHRPSGVAAATAAALGVVVSFLLFRRLTDRRTAVGATLVLAFATGTWSVSADAMWTHGLTHLTLAAGTWFAASARYTRSGLAYAAAIITRPQTAVVPLVLGTWLAVRGRQLKPAVLIGTTSALGVLAMVAYSRSVFGTWMPVGGYSEAKVAAVASGSWLEFVRRVAGTVAHPLRGVLIYAPFLVVLLRFLPTGWRAAETWVRAAAASGLLYLAVQLRANGFTGGDDFFGSRLTLETLVLVAPLLLVVWEERVRDRRPWRRMTLVLIGVAFVMHALGATVLSTTPGRGVYWERQIEEICAGAEVKVGCPSPQQR